MMSSSNDLEKLENEESINNMLLENESQNKFLICKSLETHICFLLTITIIIAMIVVFFTTLY
jgi:hypothetical protein